MVLINDTASAPPRTAPLAAVRMSVILGVSFTMVGKSEYCLHQAATISTYSGTWPTAAPIPRSDMPCGQPKFNSIPSAPVSSTRIKISFQACSSHGTISDTTTPRSGQSFLTWIISAKLTSKSRSVINSILLKPIKERSLPCHAP